MTLKASMAASFPCATGRQHGEITTEPGMYAFYHPNGDLGIGPMRSPTDAQAMVPRPVMRQPIARRAKVLK
jgi:hypothetical protein